MPGIRKIAAYFMHQTNTTHNMRSSILKISILLALIPYTSCMAKHKAGGHSDNYSYTFKPACNCIVSKDNPKGITEITVGTYDSDPELHSIKGYYTNLTGKRADTLFLTNMSPTVFQCNPCVSLENDKKYILYFEGKPDKESVEVKVTKTASGDFKELR